MTAWMATTTVDVYRDAVTTDVDEYGDPTETAETLPILEGVPAAVSAVSEDRGLPVDLRNDEVRQFAIRVAQRWDIREADRLKDRRTGAWYQVQNVTTPQALAGIPSCRLVCKRVSSSV